MKRQALQRVIEEHVHDMKKHSAKIPGAFATDDIHDLRVEYKKARAFLRLLQLEPDAGHLRIPKDIKSLYQAAGKVRDLQLFISNFPVDAPCFIEYRQKQLFHCKEALVMAIEQVHFKQALHGINKSLPGHLHDTTPQKFIDQKIATIHIILQVAEADSDLHEVRKQVKDINYTRKSEELDEIATRLGDFNDKCHALLILQSSLSDQLPAEEKQVIDQLQTNWAQEKALVQQQLLQQLQQLPITYSH